MTGLLLLLILIFTGNSILDREYYKALRVPISAGPDQIRESFRKLSRKYHPDRNPNSRKKFEKINVAYETLSNEGKKYLYDRLGAQKMDDPNIQQQKNLAALKGADIEVKLTLTLEDLYSGKNIIGKIFKKKACSHCLGSGAQNQYDIVRCTQCNGQGRTTKQVHVGGGYYNMMTQTCPRCSGQGKIIGRKCSTCSGNKIIHGSEQFKVPIKAGVFHGQYIKFINMGDQIQQGAPGDVIVKIVQAPHQRFTRQWHTLRTQINISLRQALFGFKRTIKQLDGRQLTVQRDQITQPGQNLIIQGEGMPIKDTKQKGDMIVKVNVQIPDYDTSDLSKLEKLFDEIDK